ncbi:MAG: hypothetical protein ACRDTF_00255 [Pseudonocardiaceae bacterium]
MPWRACAALYSLVEGHPVDRRGRCRSCRRPGAVLGRARRRCQVRVSACYWLHQPDETLLLSLLARELNQHPAPSEGAEEQSGPTQPPAIPPPPLPGDDSPQTGRPIPDHSEVARRRPRRLTGPELLDWIALRRVYQGGVAMLGSHYLDHGQRVPCYLPEACRRLADAELIELLDPDYPGGLRRVVITSHGRARYQELSAIRGHAAGPDQPPSDESISPNTSQGESAWPDTPKVRRSGVW